VEAALPGFMNKLESYVEFIVNRPIQEKIKKEVILLRQPLKSFAWLMFL
jgi:hypothetical protein